MNKVKLEVLTLANGRFVRPSHCLGTCGFNPKGWQLSPIRRGQSPITAFLSCNPNWKKEECEQ